MSTSHKFLRSLFAAALLAASSVPALAMTLSSQPLTAGTVTATGGSAARTLATHFSDRYNITDFAGVLCNGVTDDSTSIQAALDAVGSAGGGTIQFNGGSVCGIGGSGLVVDDSRVALESNGYGDVSHDFGGQDNGAVLKWVGAAGGTILKFASPVNATGAAIAGNGLRGITLDCNSSAAVGLQLVSTKAGHYVDDYVVECTTVGIDMVPLDTTQLGDASDVGLNLFDGIRIRESASGGIGLRLRGAPSLGANTSLNTFRRIRIRHGNGVAIQVQNADSNTFEDVEISRASGTGIGLELTGDANQSARSNVFYTSAFGAGGITIRGTETNPVAANSNAFIGLLTTNGGSAFTLGTGVLQPLVIRDDNAALGLNAVQLAVGNSVTNAALAAAGLVGTSRSMAIYNASQSGLAMLDGTGIWLLRQDASHNLEWLRVAGTGSLKVAAGLDSTPIGATTPSTGAFTTLSASGHTTFEGVTSSGATGTGKLVYDGSPALTTPNLGTPSAVNLSNATALPASALPAFTGPCRTSAGSSANTCNFQLVGFGGGTGNLTAASTRYLSSGGGDRTSSTYGTPAPYTSTLTGIYCAVGSAVGAGNQVVFTAHVNGSNTSITCTIAGGSATTCNDTAHTGAVTAGQQISVEYASSASLNAVGGNCTLIGTAQ